MVLVNHEGQACRGKGMANRSGTGDLQVAKWWQDQKAEHWVEADKATFEAKVPGYAFRVYAVARPATAEAGP